MYINKNEIFVTLRTLCNKYLLNTYIIQTFISIKILFLFTGQTGNLTPKILLKIYMYSRTIAVQTCHMFFTLPVSAFRRLAETMEHP